MFKEYLIRRFLPKRKIQSPDGRLLYQYECSDEEFFKLVDMLIEVGPPNGYDFDAYRSRWYKGVNLDEYDNRNRNWREGHEWIVRAFVLYTAVFWNKFIDEEWRKRTLHGELHKGVKESHWSKVTWLNFLSLIKWDPLYSGAIDYFVRLSRRGDYWVAHTGIRRDDFFSDDETDRLISLREERIKSIGESSSSDTELRKLRATYPGLYFSVLHAFDWWKVAFIRLPSSIRYLDSFAHQGGAGDRLVVECELKSEGENERIYRALRPPHGYGNQTFSIRKHDLPEEIREDDILSVSFTFSSKTSKNDGLDL